MTKYSSMIWKGVRPIEWEKKYSDDIGKIQCMTNSNLIFSPFWQNKLVVGIPADPFIFVFVFLFVFVFVFAFVFVFVFVFEVRLLERPFCRKEEALLWHYK